MSKKKRNKKGYYFTKETEKAIIEYNNTNNQAKKNKIYREELEWPLSKLVENIFNTFKFEYFLDDPQDVQAEVLAHLIEKLYMYDEGKGKAFSYFSIIAKNYLILNNNKNYKMMKMYQNIDDTDEVFQLEDPKENERIHNHIEEFVELMYHFWDYKIPRLFNKKRDKKIAYAIMELLYNHIDSIDVFRKKTIYLYIREMTGYGGQYITPVLNKMRPIQRKIYDDFLETGKIKEIRYI